MIKVPADGGSGGSDFPAPDNPLDNPPDNPPDDTVNYPYFALILQMFILILVAFLFAIREKAKTGIMKKVFFALPCPNCGAEVKMGATSWKNCLEEF